jgi:hypothetical protein
LGIMPIVCEDAASDTTPALKGRQERGIDSDGNTEKEWEEVEVWVDEPCTVDDPETGLQKRLLHTASDVMTRTTEASFSMSGMILAHSLARKLVARKRVVFFAPRIRIGRAHYSVSIVRKELQTEEDSVLFAANVGTVLLDIEVVDMRNRVWKLVENEDECLILVEDAILARMSEHISHSRSTPELTEYHPDYEKGGRVSGEGTKSKSLLPPVVHAPPRASRRAYALIAQRLTFYKQSHRSHRTDNQRGRRKGSRLALSVYRGSDPEWHLGGNTGGINVEDSLHDQRQTLRCKLPKTRPVKEMVTMKSPKQRERVRAKEHKLYEQRVRTFCRESTRLDLHLEYALEKKSYLDAETNVMHVDEGVEEEKEEEEEEEGEDEAYASRMVEKQRWEWEDEKATVGMRDVSSSEYSERQALYVTFAAACPEHYFGVRKMPDVLGVPRFGAMVDGEHIGEFVSEVDAAIAVDHYRLRLQPGCDSTLLNFPDARDLPPPKNLLSDY